MSKGVNCAVNFSLADFAGYEQAVMRERYLRRASCLGLNEILCGQEVRPLTAAHVMLLTLAKSPFLFKLTAAQLVGTKENSYFDGKPDIVNDIMLFLWIVSPMHQPGSVMRQHWWQRKTDRDRFNETFSPVVKLPAEMVVADILQYVEDAFLDCEDAAPGDTGKSYFADEVGIAYEMARYHGFRIDFWRPDCTLDKNPLNVPLKIVFQLRKARLQAERGKDAGLSNKSDKLIEAGLDALGERHRKEVEAAKRN